ncbi:Bug family tripartite tricarboxylate transporter substrate binding protein [Crenalkalicoccus roseus]|uniref:Bug family tripartite tricarboxylate transporter substrate binding protein n=1 Tax=Crenalkalicoccus roseus TaxID=1485588 RepID=UPI0010801DB5|nr:tripartite tricarboxylate transporter substrate binding protein [Crenalkalicoccus roseus]
MALPRLARRGLFAAITGCLGTGAAHARQAESWPARAVRIVVPFTPGGSNDALARPLAERLREHFGQSFVVENRPGAGSAVGVNFVAQSPPDGYTLLVTTSSVTAIAAVQGTDFDAAGDLDAVALLARSPLIVVVPRDSPIRTIPDLVRLERERPGSIHYASSGPGSTTHIMQELFNLRAGTRMQHVPYRGTAPALTDLAAGRVQVMFTTIASAAGPLRSGLLRLIAYTAEGRPPGTPDAPTVREQGIDYEAGIWWGLFGPRGLPPAVRRRLNEAANAALAEPGFARYLAGEGAVPEPQTPEQFAAFVREEVATMAEVVRAACIRPD